ncbi:hypothetical protein F5888DRAFT_74732 [Russula emetica]|nr:hypothetical protein F5888DRAFT_74732 [Russula emetica]
MPKVRSQRSISRAHTTSVKPVNRTFAAQDNAVQHVDVGALKDVSADELLHSVNADDPQQVPNKKERRILKHELFIEQASRAPYSKSHARRLKRREKEQLTAGGLGSLKAALPSIAPPTTRTRTTAATIIGDSSAGELDATVTTTTAAAAMIDASLKPSINKLKCKSKQQPTTDDQLEVPPPPTTRPGQIGECHGVPLMRSQGRRRALKAERFRQPLIRLNPEFAANPFETIRTHARNTLVPHRLTTT